jgi:hypothetical protein
VPTFLHDLSALQSLAEGPSGPARDWANVRLALRAPELVRYLPDARREAVWVLASGVPLVRQQLLERVRAKHPDSAWLLESLSALGLLPIEEPEPWIEALRGLWRGVDEQLQAVIAEVLADLGVFEDDLVASVSKSQRYEVQVSAAALVLRWAEHTGRALPPLAAAVAQGLLPLTRQEPLVLLDVLVRLGVPYLHPGLDLQEGVQFGATLAHGEVPTLPSTGSQRSRARRYVRQALGDRPGPAEQLLLALSELEVPDPAGLAARAAWCAHDPAERFAPVQAVLFGAGEDRALLAQARANLRSAEAPLVAIQVLGARLISNPVLALVPSLPAVMRQDEEMLPAALDHRLFEYGDQNVQAVLPYVVPLERLPDELRQHEPMAIARAAFANTEEVLSVLLELEPRSEDERVALGTALAQQADAAAYDRLLQLADGHDVLQGAVSTGALLLGRAR